MSTIHIQVNANCPYHDSHSVKIGASTGSSSRRVRYCVGSCLTDVDLLCWDAQGPASDLQWFEEQHLFVFLYAPRIAIYFSALLYTKIIHMPK